MMYSGSAGSPRTGEGSRLNILYGRVGRRFGRSCKKFCRSVLDLLLTTEEVYIDFGRLMRTRNFHVIFALDEAGRLAASSSSLSSSVKTPLEYPLPSFNSVQQSTSSSISVGAGGTQHTLCNIELQDLLILPEKT